MSTGVHGCAGRFYESDISLAPDALPSRFGEEVVPVGTAIYFLLERGSVSRWHRIASDETWHFHLGGPLVVSEAWVADGKVCRKETVLGANLAAGQTLAHVVPAGRWFGAHVPMDASEYALGA